MATWNYGWMREGGPFCTRKKFTTFDLKEAEEGADDNEEDEGRGGDED